MTACKCRTVCRLVCTVRRCVQVRTRRAVPAQEQPSRPSARLDPVYVRQWRTLRESMKHSHRHHQRSDGTDTPNTDFIHRTLVRQTTAAGKVSLRLSNSRSTVAPGGFVFRQTKRGHQEMAAHGSQTQAVNTPAITAACQRRAISQASEVRAGSEKMFFIQEARGNKTHRCGGKMMSARWACVRRGCWRPAGAACCRPGPAARPNTC